MLINEEFAPDVFDETSLGTAVGTKRGDVPQIFLSLFAAGKGYEWDFAQFEALSTPMLVLTGSESGWLRERV